MTRSAADIGGGLVPARLSRPISPGERIHVIGAAGAGASAAALLAHRAGARVTGCDPGGSSPYTAALEEAGIDLAWKHDAAHVIRGGEALADRLAVTKALTSIDPDHPELRAARARHLPLEPWQQVVADAAATRGSRLLAVAGTHGKSTATGWLVHLLVAGNRDPSAFVGALLPADLTGGIAATARWGGPELFVVEADEYAGNFDPYRPDVAVLLNAEWDHPDVFEDVDSVCRVFEAWIRAAGDTAPDPDRRAAPVPPTLVANAGDPGVARILDGLADWRGRLIVFAVEDHSGRADHETAALELCHERELLERRYRSAVGPASAFTAGVATGAQATRLLLEGPEGLSLRTTISLPGRHFAEDGVAAAITALHVGVPAAAVRTGLETFRGVGRRLELKGTAAGVTILDDYGHHPTAIAATMDAARRRYPGRRLWAVYEPLTYHRTAAMLDGFAEVLSHADRAVVAQIWAGRDPDTTVTSAAALAEATARKGRAPAVAPGTVEETADHLAGVVEPGDVVLVMGGGRSYVIAERLLATLTHSGGG